MRQYPIYLALLSLTLFSCGKNEREELVDQVKVFKTAILKNNKQQVADFFTFPIINNDLKLKAEVTGDHEIKISRLDRKTFLKNYKRIIPSDFNTLFKYLNIEDFKTQDRLEKTAIPNDKNSTCYEGCEINIENNEITFIFYTNSRKDIISTDDDLCPEYSEHWTFKLVDGKLKFKTLGIAG